MCPFHCCPFSPVQIVQSAARSQDVTRRASSAVKVEQTFCQQSP